MTGRGQGRPLYRGVWVKLRYMALGELSGHEAGRKLLAQMYREETGNDLPEIATGSRGKPYFIDSAYHFSIAHTRQMAFCVLSKVPIGIDAEELTRKVHPALAEKILSPCEYAQYQQAGDKNIALLTFWVLKEAQGKLTGAGINGYPNHTEFDLCDPRVQIINNHLIAIIE